MMSMTQRNPMEMTFFLILTRVRDGNRETLAIIRSKLIIMSKVFCSSHLSCTLRQVESRKKKSLENRIQLPTFGSDATDKS